MKCQYSVEEIYRILEDEIVKLIIKPNEMLAENSLASRFSVSRTPIRSVLQLLQENGFLRIIPGKGTFVNPINVENAAEWIYLRVAVESTVLRDFIRSSSPTDIENVRYALSMLDEAAKGAEDLASFDINNFLQRDLEMHRIWFNATKKMGIWNTITKPHPDYSRFIRLDILGAKNVPDVLKDHHEMMDMIDRKETDNIEELMKRHLYGGIRRLGSKLFTDEYKNYFQPSF